MIREPPIVEQLRDLDGQLHQKAAAEIERLRAALAGIACWSIDHNDAKARANRTLEPKS